MSAYSDLRMIDSNEFVLNYLLGCKPHIFRAQCDYNKWRLKVSEFIDVDPSSIHLSGSGAIGFSLNPSKNLKKFDINSDIDISVVSERHFKTSWRHLRKTNLRNPQLTATMVSAIKRHCTNNVYWGFISAHEILSILPFFRDWETAISWIRDNEPCKDRRIGFRLFGDFESLISHYERSITEINRPKPTVTPQIHEISAEPHQ